MVEDQHILSVQIHCSEAFSYKLYIIDANVRAKKKPHCKDNVYQLTFADD